MHFLSIIIGTLCIFGQHISFVNGCGDFILASPIEETLLVISPRDFGKTITLRCNLKLNSMCKISFVNISWTHNGNTMELSDDKYINQPFQYKIDGDLTIPNFSRDHMGIYQCSVTEPRGTIVAMPINLFEEYISPPQIKMRSKSGYVEPEDVIALYCAFEYKSPFKPRVSWYKNGFRLSLTPSKKRLRKRSKSTCYAPNESEENMAICRDGEVHRMLYFWNISDVNTGNYSCKVYLNTIEKMSSMMKIDFNDVGLSEVNELPKEPLPNSIYHIDSKDYIAYINGRNEIFVHCGLPFFQSHNVEWTMISTRTSINKSDSIPVLYYAGKYLAKLRRGFNDAFYNFTCKYSKTYLANTSDNDPAIYNMSHTTIITLTRLRYRYTGNNLYVLKGENNISISGIHDKFDHVALATQRTWYFNGRIFDASDEHVMIEPDMRTLVIQNITESQEGYYQCIIVTQYYKYVSTHLVLTRHRTEMFPSVNLEIEKVTDNTIYCKIKMFIKDLVFPICGYLVCHTENFNFIGHKIIILSERTHSNKSFIEYSLPIFHLTPDTNYSVYASYKSSNAKGFEASNETYDIKTNESAPIYCPTFYLAELRSTSAIVKWFPLSAYKRYGQIINHELTWNDPLDYNSTNSILFNASVYQYSIEDLKPGTAYYVTVKSKNAAGFCRQPRKQLLHTIENKTLQFSVNQYIKDLKYNGYLLRWVLLKKAKDKISQFSMHTFDWNGIPSIVRIPSTSCDIPVHSSDDCVFEKPTLLLGAILSLHLKAIKFHNSSSSTVFSKLVYPHPHKVTPYIKLVHACYNHGQTKIFKWTKNRICYFSYQIRQQVFDTNGEEFYKYYPISYDKNTIIWVQQWFDASLLNISITMDKINTIQLSCSSDIEGISEPPPVCNNNLPDDSKPKFPPYLECRRLNTSNIVCAFISNGTIDLTITPPIHSFVIKITQPKYVNPNNYFIPQFVQYYHYPLTFKNGTTSSLQFELKLAAESENSTTLQTASCLSATFCSTWGPVQAFSDVLLANYLTNSTVPTVVSKDLESPYPISSPPITT